MTYLAATAAIILVIALLLSRKSSKKQQLPYSNASEFRSFLADLRARALALPESERLEMVDEARRLARAGYNRLFEGAAQIGKDENFSHQAGVLDAVCCVYANEDPMRQHEGIRRLMQCETPPFNVCTPDVGKPAIIEYLVWKFSPQDADVSVIERAIAIFVEKVRVDAESGGDRDGVRQRMIYSGQFDWQILAVEVAGRSTHPDL